MPKRKIHFIGFLTNCDESVLKVKLGHGFKLKKMQYQEVHKWFYDLDKYFTGFGSGILNLWTCLDVSTQSIYCITNSFTCDVNARNLRKGLELHNKLHDTAGRFDKELIDGYLIPKICLMRLFKEGNIYLLSHYYLAYSKSRPIFNRTMLELSYRPQIKWSIKDAEIQQLNRFIRDVRIPFSKPFLQLAFEAFELSYKIPDSGLAFLSLMIALELMFTKEREGLSYALARNTAVLLGGTEEEANFIFHDIKNFCRKRGGLVHAGERRKIKPEDVLKLRDYVRKAIKEINAIGKDKKEILEILKACGFSQRSWKH